MEAGIVPYRSYQDGQFDSVDTLNGNVLIHIPLVSFPQRGRVHLSFSRYQQQRRWVGLGYPEL